MRTGTTAVPGCAGEGSTDDDYCVAYSPNLLIIVGNDGEVNDPEGPFSFPLQACQGDCDDDDDDECMGPLVCELRDAKEVVPGCLGEGLSGKDYCRILDVTLEPTISLVPTEAQPTVSPTSTASPNRMLYGANGDTVTVDMNTQHAVRCCSENGDLNWQDNCLSISGVISQTIVPECYTDKTFTEALEICSAYEDGRLCSGEEIEDSCTSDMGCGANSYDCDADCKGLETTFENNNRSRGNFFTIKALQDIFITSFTIHTVDSGTGTVRIYEKEGSYSGSESNADDWNLIMNDPNVNGQGTGQQTPLGKLDTALFIPANTFHSFHIYSSLLVQYTNGGTEGDVYTENPGEIIFYEGLGADNEFGNTFSPRIWNGIIGYGLDNTLVWGCTDAQGVCVTDAECCAGLCSEQGVCKGPVSMDEVSISTTYMYTQIQPILP